MSRNSNEKKAASQASAHLPSCRNETKNVAQTQRQAENEAKEKKSSREMNFCDFANVSTKSNCKKVELEIFPLRISALKFYERAR